MKCNLSIYGEVSLFLSLINLQMILTEQLCDLSNAVFHSQNKGKTNVLRTVEVLISKNVNVSF